MANTYSKIYIHIVFAIKFREALISPDWEDLLYKYLTGIITNKKEKLMAINGMPDHIHILVSLGPDCVISDLVREMKKASTNFINANALCRNRFQWQQGFGAFSLHEKNLNTVINYIKNQKIQHSKSKFKDEYIRLLVDSNTDFKEKYLFDFIETSD